MKLLALDTVGEVGSIALLEDAALRVEVTFSHGLRTTGAALEAIQFALKETGWTLPELDLYAVDKGPGFFTSLKVGVQMIKSLAQPQNKPVLGVGSLEVLAHDIQLPPDCLLACCFPARKEEIYVQLFTREGVERDAYAIAVDEFVATLQSEQRLIALTGEGVFRYRERFSNLPRTLTLPGRYPAASQVGLLAYERREHAHPANELLPDYVKAPSISVSKRKIPVD